MSSIHQLQRLIIESEYFIAFTGAGISAESGVPAYRGVNGLWRAYDPNKFASIDYFMRDPVYYWRFFQEVRYPIIKAARPNQSHHTLAALEQGGVLKAVITQNIDGLHQLAGSKRVLELHGNTRQILCLDCHRRFSMEQVYTWLDRQLPPVCPDCGGRLKPDVVFFGEPLPAKVLEEAMEETRQCDLLLVVGSSLVVQPAASLPSLAAQQGSRLVILNVDPTPFDPIADLVYHCPASEVFNTLDTDFLTT